MYCGLSTASKVFLIFTTRLYQFCRVIFLFMLFSDKPEVFFPKYSQPAKLHAAHFQGVVKQDNITLLVLQLVWLFLISKQLPSQVSVAICADSQGFFLGFFNCMFYQLLCVQHSCSSTQSWGSVLPSIVETRDKNSRGCPLLFSNRNRCIGDRNPIHPQPLGSCGPLQE